MRSIPWYSAAAMSEREWQDRCDRAHEWWQDERDRRVQAEADLAATQQTLALVRDRLCTALAINEGRLR